MSQQQTRTETLPAGKSDSTIKLTTRDRRILLLLGEYGCVSSERIKTQFWNENPKCRNHYRRLGLLKKQHLVENVMGDGGIMIGYRLTKKGKQYCSEVSDKNQGHLVRRGYKTQFEHDQLLIDVRRVLQESPLVKNFKTEAEVRKELLSAQTGRVHWEDMPTIPDAVFTFETPGQTMSVAIELELTQKTRGRYTRILRNHLLSKKWSLVLYITKDRNFQERLMKILTEIKATDVQLRIAKSVNGIYFCSLEDFLVKKLFAPLTNGKREISFGQIAQNYEQKTGTKHATG